MRRNLDIRNHREKLDQNSTKTNQTATKNFASFTIRQRIWLSVENLTKILTSSDFVADSLKRCAIKNEYDMQNLKNIHRAV